MRAIDVVPYLLERRLLDSRDVMRPGLSIVAAPRRNNNFKVINPDGSGLLVKQAVSPDRALTLAREASAYQMFTTAPGPARPWIPTFHRYDDESAILVLGLLPGAQTIGEHVAGTGRASRGIATALGTQVAELHALDVPMKDDARNHPLFDGPPWILDVACPDASVLQTSSAASLQLIRLVQSSTEFCELIDGLRQNWRIDSLVHRDLRWDNCLFPRGAARKRAPVTIVDWEMCGKGDAAWDLGTLFGGYLRLWLGSVPIIGDVPLERALGQARFPLEKLHPAMRSLWDAYLSKRAATAEAPTELAIRVSRFAAANLLQTVFETAQASMTFSPHLTYFVQLSFNILQRPAEAAVHLLGLDLETGI
jgi:hypothetical protein